MTLKFFLTKLGKSAHKTLQKAAQSNFQPENNIIAAIVMPVVREGVTKNSRLIFITFAEQKDRYNVMISFNEFTEFPSIPLFVISLKFWPFLNLNILLSMVS